MKTNTKNWIVFSFQLQFFTILTIIIFFFEILRLCEVIFPPNFSPFRPPLRMGPPSIQETILSISILTLLILNLSIATFSMYAFIFIIQIFDSNSARTAPVCAFAIDCAIINLFLYHFSLYKEHYFTIFAPQFLLSYCFHIPSFISQISEILMVITFFTIFINLQFGIDGIKKRRKLKTNKMTDFIHILLIKNGILAIFFLYLSTDFLAINYIGLIISTALAVFLIGFFNLMLRVKNIDYPIEAIARWRYGKVITKEGKKE